MAESYPSTTKSIDNHIPPCLIKDSPCTESAEEQSYSLHINCGGKEVTINKTKYDADRETVGASTFSSNRNWAFSSTGHFMDDGHESDIYVLSNTSNLYNISTFDTSLYTQARRSAISLTYYGLCLMNGYYNVKLHFSEIVLNQVYPFIIGKRVFDVYVQGTLRLKDFDILKEAGGPGRAIIKSFTVNVRNNTLKIQLYWAGKGTTNIPSAGTYGPIISAISVDPNFKPRLHRQKTNKLGLISGMVVGGSLLIIVSLIIIILWRKQTMTHEVRGMDLPLKTSINIFPMRQIKTATNNFDEEYKIGEGGFGPVYKGRLSDGTMIAVKQLSSKSKQGANQFLNEIATLSAVQHPNIVRLYGCCVEDSRYCLIYEYMETNSLSHALFGERLNVS
ncbi:hypothetical protein QVD17_42282 [Tagetes erecta]|uniref:non-specific serine/threonine protein kinase n=1 Tax=Tagetes erecta TaxID=13708 RepID=A0AAD8JK81_TARER|nr:hypothetical protein QVD17_42282 [Tagetes erecta]